MKTKIFRENFELVSSKSGLKAVPKSGGGFPEAITADGAIFNPDKKYYFFDRDSSAVRLTVGLRRIDESWLGSFGLRVVEIGRLRKERNDALGDGQSFFRNQIAELNEKIADFEAEKSE